MKLALTFLLLSATAALATPADAPAPIDPNKQIPVTMTVQDWGAVVAAIGDSALKARDANRIVRAIISQVQQQVQQPEAPTAKK